MAAQHTAVNVADLALTCGVFFFVDDKPREARNAISDAARGFDHIQSIAQRLCHLTNKTMAFKNLLCFSSDLPTNV